MNLLALVEKRVFFSALCFGPIKGGSVFLTSRQTIRFSRRTLFHVIGYWIWLKSVYFSRNWQSGVISKDVIINGKLNLSSFY